MATLLPTATATATPTAAEARQKVWLLNYFNLVGFWGDDNSYKMRAKKKDAAQLGKNQRGQALEAVKREIYFEQAL